VSRLLKAPAIAIVGPLSYSIYLTHQIIIAMVNNGVQIGATLISSCWHEADFFANPWWMDVVLLVFIAAMIGAVWCANNLIEVPCGVGSTELRAKYHRSAKLYRWEFRSPS